MVRSITGLVMALCLLGNSGLHASQTVWQEIGASARGFDTGGLFKADEAQLRALLQSAPHEVNEDHSYTIQLPMPDGSLADFVIVESPIMETGFMTDFPDIKTFKVFGIDDPLASGRVDITPQGFHAMLMTAAGRLFIDPIRQHQQGRYHSRYRSSRPSRGFSCGIHELDSGAPSRAELASRAAARIPGNLLQYRLAVAATEEYVTAVTGNVTNIAGAQAEIVTAINRVNVIYERDLGIQLLLVAGNQNLIEDGGNVAFSNNNAFTMFGQNQTWIDTTIGSANYDLGHVFSTGGGGLAQIASVCDATDKAKGVTGLSNPTGDPFYIDYVAHEIGHQFSANHSFNGTTGSCSGLNRNAATAFEPGSGSTIMGYAGLCGVEDLQNISEATFHAGSIAEIDLFTAAAGNCYVQSANSNADPIITAIANSSIPVNTPFALSASATDADSPGLSYQWDQMDAGTATNSVSFGNDLGNNALFRTYEPQTSNSRDFPALGTQIQGLFDDAEVLPQQTRTVNMRVTVRDNETGQDTEDVALNVIGGAGPFRITTQTTDSTVVFSSATFFVNWNVANTASAPISCSNVAIELLAFDDAAYTNHSVHTLLASTANDGSATVLAPTEWLQSPARGRIRVSCTNNVFYALSQADIFFEGDLPRVDFDDNDISTFFNNGGTTGTSQPGSSSTGIPAISTGGGGSGLLAPIWLFLFAALGLADRMLRRQN